MSRELAPKIRLQAFSADDRRAKLQRAKSFGQRLLERTRWGRRANEAAEATDYATSDLEAVARAAQQAEGPDARPRRRTKTPPSTPQGSFSSKGGAAKSGMRRSPTLSRMRTTKVSNVSRP